MPVFNLTRLVPKSQVEEEGKWLNPQNLDAGRWSRLSSFGDAKLETLAMNIAPASSLETVKAVPDPWAHPRTFAASVLDPKHPLHEVSLGQWRWLLAVIGLSRFRENDYDLKLVPTELDASGNQLENMLVALMPKKHLWTEQSDATAQSDWRSLVLVRLTDHHDDKTYDLGFINPACLISSGRRFGALRGIVSTVPWIKAGMKDPVDLLGSDERRLLKAYLVKAQKSLDELLGPTLDTNWGRMSERLNEFSEELGEDSSSEIKFEQREGTLKPLYRPLLNVPNEEKAETDCQIAATQLILIDAGLANTLGKDPSQVRVWKKVTLAQALQRPKVLEDVRQDRDFLDAGYSLVTPEDLIASGLYRLVHPTHNLLQFNRHGSELCKYLLPIKPLGLSLMSSQDVPASVRLRDGQVMLKADISYDGGRISYWMTKAMDQKDIACSDGNIALWPNFHHEDWTEYYARLRPTGDGASQYDLVPVDACSWSDAIKADVQTPVIMNRVVRSASGTPIDVILCSAVKDGDVEFSGLILLDPTRRATDKTDPTHVAIDFGTTGTIAMMKEADRPISFRDRVRQPMWAPSSEAIDRALNLVSFFPGSATASEVAQPTPVLSAWRPDEMWASHGGGMPLFLPAIDENKVPALLDYLGQVRSNLKWNYELHDLAMEYLQRIGMMISAELRDNGKHIESWWFSFPRALSRDEDKLAAFQAGVRKRFPKSHFIQEDKACALAAFDQKHARDTTVILDIGGGTTDVTILQRHSSETNSHRWAWLGSLQIAGMAFFTRTMAENAALRDWLGISGWGSVLEGIGDPHARAFRLELLMNNDTLEKAIDDKWPWRSQESNKPHADRLEAAAICYMAGIAWYIGKVAAASDAVDLQWLPKVAFRFCGRGSRFLLKLNESGSRNRFAKAVELFHAAAGVDGDVRISGEPAGAKQEVVLGALTETRGVLPEGLLNDPAAADDRLYHVLGVTDNGQHPSHVGEGAGTGIPVIDTAEFQTFLDALKERVGLEYQIDDLSESLQALTHKRENDVRKEAAFIVALRWLVGATSKEEDGVSWRLR